MINMIASVRKSLKTQFGYFSALFSILGIGWATHKWVLGPSIKRHKQEILQENAEYLYTHMKLQEEQKRQEIFT